MFPGVESKPDESLLRETEKSTRGENLQARSGFSPG